MEEKTYHIVEFLDSNSVDIVPSLWICEDGADRWSRWPPTAITRKSENMLKLVTQHKPPESCWKNYKIRILYSNDNYMKCRAKLDAAEGNSDLASEVESGKRKIRQPAEWTENETSESSDEEVNKNKLPRPPVPFAGLPMLEDDVLHQQVQDRMDSDISPEEIDQIQQKETDAGSINMDGVEKTRKSASQLNRSKSSTTTNAGVNQAKKTDERAADTGVNQVQETPESAADTEVNHVEKALKRAADTGVDQVQKTPESAVDTEVNQVQKTLKCAADTGVNQVQKTPESVHQLNKSKSSSTTTFDVNQVEKALDEMKPVSKNVRMSPTYSRITRLTPLKRQFNESHMLDTKRMKKTSKSAKKLKMLKPSSTAHCFVDQDKKALDEMKPVSKNVRMSPTYSKRLSTVKRKYNESHIFNI